jgi:hypothetical protein
VIPVSSDGDSRFHHFEDSHDSSFVMMAIRVCIILRIPVIPVSSDGDSRLHHFEDSRDSSF